jgi:hypothetical protein
MRRRDERFKDQGKYKAAPDPLYDKRPAPKPASSGKFRPTDFAYDAKNNTCICPAGKRLYSSGQHCTIKGRTHRKFKGALRDCVPCKLRDQCLRTPDRTRIRQVAFFHQSQASPLRHTEAMKRRIDSPAGRAVYGDVELPDALMRKYPRAPYEWAWKFVFPSYKRSVDPATGVIRRHHVYENYLIRGVKEAARAAGIAKHVSCHTLRHYAESRTMPSPRRPVFDCARLAQVCSA